MADMLAALLNNSMYTYKVAGPQVIVEQLLVRRMAALAGFEQGEGAFTPGGSLSNFLAMVLARGERFPETRAEGLSGRRATVYTSQLSHYSIRKGAVLAGIGRDRVRMIATDARGRMCADDLRAWLTRDREEGLEPLFVNLTAGTTVLGAFDPLPELIEVAREHGLWVHVDGALGGSMLLSPRHRHLLAGLEQADSFTWDAHKTMGVPLTCSVCLVRERGVLMRHLADQADYLFQDDCELDRGLTSLQCGRRNDALKLWAAWQHLGDAGFAARVEAVVDRAAYAARCVEASPGLRLVRPPESVNVCFTVEGVDAPSLCQALHERGRAMVGYAKVDGHEVVRLACASADLREADLDQFFEDVLQTAAELRAM
jgi:glutamate/tyrosine decarboxylase-like PLP-dependent enzyme